jgi:hypothetical protein
VLKQEKVLSKKRKQEKVSGTNGTSKPMGLLSFFFIADASPIPE